MQLIKQTTVTQGSKTRAELPLVTEIRTAACRCALKPTIRREPIRGVHYMEHEGRQHHYVHMRYLRKKPTAAVMREIHSVEATRLERDNKDIELGDTGSERCGHRHV